MVSENYDAPVEAPEPVVKEIRLYGHLGRRFGRLHHFDVQTPAEAIRALRANFPEFTSEVMSFKGDGYRVTCGKNRTGIAADKLANPIGEDSIKILPFISGAGNGFGQILVGAALIGIGIATGGAGMTLAAAWAVPGMSTIVGAVAFNIGMSLVLGGVAQMLAPSPETRDVPDRPDNKASFSFNGPVNTVVQGNAVPVLYGQLWVGSQVISAGLSSEEYAA